MRTLILFIAIMIVWIAFFGEKAEGPSIFHYEHREVDSTSVIELWQHVCDSWKIKFPLVVISQYTWETDWGTSEILEQNNNGFGMKRNRKSRFQNGEKNGHASYPSLAASVADYARWQKKLLEAHPEVDTDEKYLQLLGDYNVPWCPDCRYAEDTTYTTKIRGRMKEIMRMKNLPPTR